jgi:hypothetical protein
LAVAVVLYVLVLRDAQPFSAYTVQYITSVYLAVVYIESGCIDPPVWLVLTFLVFMACVYTTVNPAHFRSPPLFVMSAVLLVGAIVCFCVGRAQQTPARYDAWHGAWHALVYASAWAFLRGVTSGMGARSDSETHALAQVGSRGTVRVSVLRAVYNGEG